jgi:hypothetical protein
MLVPEVFSLGLAAYRTWHGAEVGVGAGEDLAHSVLG